MAGHRALPVANDSFATPEVPNDPFATPALADLTRSHPAAGATPSPPGKSRPPPGKSTPVPAAIGELLSRIGDRKPCPE